MSVATASASLPVAWRLYLPEAWTADSERRAKARVPEEVAFRTKPAIALAQIEAALAEGVPPGTVLGDTSYGNDSGFRSGVAALGLDYVLGVLGTATVWPPGTEPAVPAYGGRSACAVAATRHRWSRSAPWPGGPAAGGLAGRHVG